jgi:PAS domain-containing protein
VAKLILHLERLPVSESTQAQTRHVVDLGTHGRGSATSTPLGRWSAAVAAAQDPCLVLDPQGQVLSISASAAELMGCSDAGVIGRRLIDVADLVDFETGLSGPDYATRIAPIAVIAGGGGLMRSLLRVRHSDGSRLTVDASAAPIHDAQGVAIGSITFLAPVRG